MLNTSLPCSACWSQAARQAATRELRLQVRDREPNSSPAAGMLCSGGCAAVPHSLGYFCFYPTTAQSPGEKQRHWAQDLSQLQAQTHIHPHWHFQSSLDSKAGLSCHPAIAGCLRVPSPLWTKAAPAGARCFSAWSCLCSQITALTSLYWFGACKCVTAHFLHHALTHRLYGFARRPNVADLTTGTHFGLGKGPNLLNQSIILTRIANKD